MVFSVKSVVIFFVIVSCLKQSLSQFDFPFFCVYPSSFQRALKLNDCLNLPTPSMLSFDFFFVIYAESVF